jgi:hypothetical protein
MKKKKKMNIKNGGEKYKKVKNIVVSDIIK